MSITERSLGYFENRRAESFVGDVQKVHLRQHACLPIAKEISDIHSLTAREVANLYRLGDAACTRRFFAIAGTQLKENAFKLAGVNSKLNNFIYFADYNSPELNNKLVLQPKLTVEEDIYEPHVESCGSLNNAKWIYIAERPSKGVLEGYIADSRGELEECHIKLEGFSFRIAHHESKHLEGLTALDEPDRLVHPKELTSSQIQNMDSSHPISSYTLENISDYIRKCIPEAGYSWVVPTEDKRKWTFAQI